MSTPRPFRFGVNHVTTSGADWLETARKIEALGYHTLIAQDHFGPQLAPLPALVAAGSVTSTLRLTTMVLDNDFRHPAVVAKEAATVDVLTGGRLELGLGAGWLEADYTKLGLTFGPPAERLARLAEAVEICRAFFDSPTPVTFAGTYYQVAELDAAPRPLQAHLPLMVGGRQRRMLALAGRTADIVGLSLLDRRGPGLPEPPTLAQKVAWVRDAAGERADALELHVNLSLVAITDDPASVIEAAAAQRGVDPAEVRDAPGTLVGSLSDVVDQLRQRRAELGITYYVVQGRFLDAFAPVVARLA